MPKILRGAASKPNHSKSKTRADAAPHPFASNVKAAANVRPLDRAL
jgi:hypothetical protein